MSGLPSSVPSPTGRYQFTITLPSNCPWTARTEQSWSDIAPGSGTGTATVTLNVNENASFSTRTTTVLINNQSFQVVQMLPGCTYSLDRTTLDAEGSGGTARIELNTGVGCPWTVSASESWIGVVTSAGTGSGAILLEIAPNPSDVRHASLTIAGQRVEVIQRRR